MNNKDNFDRFKAEAMQELYEGKKMGGTDGVFPPNCPRMFNEDDWGLRFYQIIKNRSF